MSKLKKINPYCLTLVSALHFGKTNKQTNKSLFWKRLSPEVSIFIDKQKEAFIIRVFKAIGLLSGTLYPMIPWITFHYGCASKGSFPKSVEKPKGPSSKWKRSFHIYALLMLKHVHLQSKFHYCFYHRKTGGDTAAIRNVTLILEHY